MHVLFLNENPLPKIFTKGTVAAKELRIRTSIDEIEKVIVVTRTGRSMVKPGKDSKTVGELEKKIELVHVRCPYYLSGLFLFWRAVFVLLSRRVDVIEAESPVISGPAVVLLGWLFRKPSIVEVRSSYQELVLHRFKFIPKAVRVGLTNFVYWNVLRRTTAVIANSEYYRKFLHEGRVESVVINPGIQYPPVRKKRLSDQKVIGFVGRLVPEKGVDVLLKAFAKLQSNDDINDYQLEIAGSGPEFNILKDLARSLNISDRVRFLGFSDAFDVLNRWDLMVNPIVVPTPLEMANAEAAYMGVPVICFGDDNYPETVQHMYSGYKVHSVSVDELAEAIAVLISDAKLRTRLSSNASLFAKKNYDFKQQVKGLRRLYMNLGLL